MLKKSHSELILYCHHCGNATGHILLCEAPSINVGYIEDDPNKADSFECIYYLVRCKTCSGISLYYDDEFDHLRGYITEAHLCYPLIVKMSEEIPDSIAKTFNEAMRVEIVSVNAYAILIRRTLELLCRDKNATGKNLKEQLDSLASFNIIPVTLCQMGQTLRILGNFGAHASDYKLDISEIRAMRDFTVAMLEYVYVAPAKLEKLKQSIQKKTKNPVSN